MFVRAGETKSTSLRNVAHEYFRRFTKSSVNKRSELIQATVEGQFIGVAQRVDSEASSATCVGGFNRRIELCGVAALLARAM